MQDYEEVFRAPIRKGSTMSIRYAPEEVKPWGAVYRGCGHYFRSLEAVLAYCYGRGWIRAGDLDALERDLCRTHEGGE